MSWSGVKRQTNVEDIKSWCEEMGIRNYTINNKGEIDVDECVEFKFNSKNNKFKELPFKFGTINGYFSLDDCRNLISLKNCPTKIKNSFYCNNCISLISLEGCPEEVGGDFRCRYCKRKFTEREIRSLCEVKRDIMI